MRKKALVLLVLSAILVAGAHVSALEPGVGSSKTADVTGGLFIEDPDRASDVTRFLDIENDLVHTKLQSSTILDLGVGMDLGSFYLGAYYFGDIIDRDRFVDETTQTQEIVTGNSEVVGVTETYPGGIDNEDELDIDNMNYFDALFGFGTIGVAANVLHQADTNSVERPYNGDTITEDADGNLESETRGSRLDESGETTLRPGIRVGTVLPLGSMTLRPYVGARVGFVRIFDSGNKGPGVSELTSYTRVVGSGLPSHRGMDDVESYQKQTDTEEDTYTSLNVFLGAVAETEEWDLGLKYALDTRLNYEIVDEYTNHQFDTNVVNTGDTRTIDETDTTNAEITYMQHRVQPMVQRNFESRERFDAALGFGLDFELISQQTDRSRESETTTVLEDPDPMNNQTVVVTQAYEVTNEEYTEFSIDPSVTAAMQYQIVPDRVRLNGSTTVRLPGYYRQQMKETPSGVGTTETVTTDGDGTVTRTFTQSLAATREAEYSSETGFGSDASENLDVDVSYAAGLTFDLTENLRLDTQMAATQPIDISRFDVQLVVTW